MNGIAFGSASSLLNQNGATSVDTIRFSFSSGKSDDLPHVVELTVPDEENTSASRSLYVQVSTEGNRTSRSEPFFFSYLSAERNGPRVSQEQFSDESESGTVGSKGEFSAEVLLHCERRKIRAELVHEFPDGAKPGNILLLQAVQDWMSAIVGAVEIRVTSNGNCPPSIWYKRPGVTNEWVLSTNTGFGISYTLPIVVAGLLSQPGGFLIVDSPEAHLHPAAQTALAKFLAWVASAGTHVIIETHSDHIIDGIRLATVTPELRLNADECAILNIQRSADEQHFVEELKIERNGRLSRWPNGFFDQQTKNLKDIADASRRSRPAP